ncbi:MAG: hypothetical protein WAR59_13695, partial [Ignavibacteriaceae bacterium]
MKNLIALLFVSLTNSLFAGENPKLVNDILTIEYNNRLHSKIICNLPNTEDLMKSFFPSEQLILSNQTLLDFNLVDMKEIKDDNSISLILTGKYSNEKFQIRKEIKTEIQKAFPDFLITKATYTNTGLDTISVLGWINNCYNI